MDPWDYPLVPLLTCVGNSTFVVNCFFFPWTSEIRDNWLTCSAKKCFLRIEFLNGEQLSPAKMYRVMLQSGNAFEPKSMAFISSLRAAEKKITGAHCCLRFWWAVILRLITTFYAVYNKIKLSLNQFLSSRGREWHGSSGRHALEWTQLSKLIASSSCSGVGTRWWKQTGKYKQMQTNTWTSVNKNKKAHIWRYSDFGNRASTILSFGISHLKWVTAKLNDWTS